MALTSREALRDRAGALVEEACAWAVGLSDRPWVQRRHGRVVDGGQTIGSRALSGLPLAGEEDARLELGDAAPGSFQDALGALAPDGTLLAERFDDEVLVPFALAAGVVAAGRLQRADPQGWADLLDELGEDGSDLEAVVRAGEWDAPLRADAEQLVLGALGRRPLAEVEAEGLPLAVVRAAEAQTRAAAERPPAAPPGAAALEGAVFLAEAAVAGAGLTVPVPPDEAEVLLLALRDEGLEEDEVLAVLPLLPLAPGTAAAVAARLSP
ncbi:hypothetical protein D5H78_03640 [Vallicoccus soli]|uniref:Uncharacterized protein n=2 Tax=Vallicoccus soli TaxID=2339232 RepID=A0A3A3Z925_9ACTN|nr:hypothetical protein D5H78_03640 [Vallicoccus soli]